jgi:hypothetical protein
MRSSRCLHLILAAVVLTGATTSSAGTLIDVAFTDAPATTKMGFAATGLTTSDFWNTCTANGFVNLKVVDGTPSGAGLTISGVESTYENGSADPMFGTYFYSEVPTFSSGIVVTITNLPAGPYDFYFYGHGNEDYENSVFQLAVGSESYGSLATIDGGTAWLSPVWQEGIQYVEFHANVPAGQTVTITALPGASQWSFISGIQIAPAPMPYIATPPTSQYAVQGAASTFDVLAIGAAPLFYQWQFNGASISGATNTSYMVADAQLSSQGNYAVVVSNSYGSVTSTPALLVVNSQIPSFIDVAFTDASATSKRGFAAVGLTTNDFWNACTTNGVADLDLVNGAASGVGLTISGVETFYENGAADPMYGTYFYAEVPSFSSGIVVTITNLTAGPYAFYIYGHGNEDDENSVFQLAVDSESYGSQATDGSGDAAWLSPVWQEGIQYVEFHANVPPADAVTITAEPGASQWSFISGFQIVPVLPPYLVTPPTNQQVFQNTTATFNVFALGAVPLVYQWLFNGANISGATNSSFTVTNVQFSSQEAYSVIVTNAYGSVTSTAVSLVVFSTANPLIDVAFTDASATTKTGFAAAGETIIDYWNTCTTNGVADLAYSDATPSAASMTISGVETFYENGSADPMFGTYFYAEVPSFSSGIVVTITNLTAGAYAFYVYGHGNEYYENSVFQLAVGSESYGSQATIDGGTAWLSPEWQEGIQYVEFHANVPVGQTVTITALPGASQWSFISGIQIAPAPMPYIATSPTSQYAVPGAASTFNVLAVGAAPLLYQWQFNGANISGATNTSYTVANAQLSSQGNYAVVVSNAYGSVTSTAASLIVNSQVPSFIDVDFTDASATSKRGFAAAGLTANDFWNACTTNGVADLDLVTGTASGVGLTISGVETFYENGAADPMYGTYFYAEVPSFSSGIVVTITNLTAGAYAFYVYGHGNEDYENSVFQLEVGSESYGSQATIDGGTAWLSPVWQEGIQYVEFHANVSPADAVTITALPGASQWSFISGIQIVPVLAPYILTPPEPQYAVLGAAATFNVLAVGVAPLFYQWQFNGANISEATNISYMVANAQLSSQGNYAVVVSNAYGSVTSTAASLFVNSQGPSFIDVAFTDASATSKRGFAAAGLTTNDFWNACTTNGVADLDLVDGTASGVGLSISGVEASYENGAADPMFGTYFYAEVPTFSSGIVVRVQNLAAGPYAFYIYGHGNENDENSVFQVSVRSQSYGSQATDGVNASWLSPVWQEGIQYVEFHANALPGEPVAITAEPGASQWSFISGIQIVPAFAPYLVTAPTNQQVLQNTKVTFNVLALGAVPLVYQWLFNGANISGATNSSFTVTDVQSTRQGDYSVIVTNAYGSVTSGVAALNVIVPVANVIDVAFTSASVTSKVGFAATGETTNDFWNSCTANGAANLKFADGTPSGASVTTTGVENAYENGAADPMFGTDFYTEVPSFSSGILVSITNLSADLYDFYIYGHGNVDDENSVFQVTVASQSYGSQATDGADAAWLSPQWQEGIQYVEFTNVSISAGQVVTIKATPDDSPYSFISGMQMVPFVLPTNGSPLIINTPNQFVNANQGFIVTNYAFSAAGPISFALGSNAPSGATITADGIFFWTPTCEQGSTSNPITVWATDSSIPPLSNSMTFSVIVGECVEVSIGSNVVQAGQSTCVPVNLVATVGLTNLKFTLAYLSGFLTNWNVTPSNSAVSSSSAQTVDPSHTEFAFGVQSGQVLQGTTLLGSICLDTLPGASAFVPLSVVNLGAVGPNNSPVTNFIGETGRVVVIGPQSLLEASLDTNLNRILTLYGNPGVSYELLSTPNLAIPWITFGNVTLTDLFQNISLGSATNQAQFFKAVQP